MELHKVAAFSVDGVGGNPAGVALCERFPACEKMQAIAAKVGYSETAFLTPTKDGKWYVRYFAPADEVEFCGHATIASGAILAEKFGNGLFDLELRSGQIAVNAQRVGARFQAELISPCVRHRLLPEKNVTEIMSAFGLTQYELDPYFAPAMVSTLQEHPAFVLKSREALSALTYNANDLRDIFKSNDFATIIFAYRKTPQRFHVRNFFVSGDIIEDPATGSAAAAFAGYLRDSRNIPFDEIEFIQGEDMGVPCRIFATYGRRFGSPVHIEGEAVRL